MANNVKEFGKPVEISNLLDIRKILEPILNDTNSGKVVEFNCDIKWSADGASGSNNVKGHSTDSSLYRLLLDGFNVVKQCAEAYKKASDMYNNVDIDDVIKLDESIWNVDNMHFNVDSLIHNRLGGKRNGMRVRWTVQEGVFEFDPYERKLFKV